MVLVDQVHHLNLFSCISIVTFIKVHHVISIVGVGKPTIVENEHLFSVDDVVVVFRGMAFAGFIDQRIGEVFQTDSLFVIIMVSIPYSVVNLYAR